MLDTNPYDEFSIKLRERFMKLLPDYIGTAHSRAGTKIIRKEDGTPVVDLDRHSLEQLRTLIKEYFPDDYIVGEEDQKSDSEMAAILARMDQYQWTVDGLDGTWHFIRGTNSYGAQIARRRGTDVLYAGVFRPVDMKLRGNGFFSVVNGGETQEWCSDCGLNHPRHVALPGTLERRTILFEGGSKLFFRKPMVGIGAMETTRPSLSSCIAATTVARGDASAVVTKGHKPWDGWPILAIVQGAGGIVTDHDGNSASAEDCSNLIAAATEEDHAHILGILQSQR
jgi:inositol-phosphate phosphatase / L-galactose 1-phosphate phosphatase / histidinol-phosphatase